MKYQVKYFLFTSIHFLVRLYICRVDENSFFSNSRNAMLINCKKEPISVLFLDVDKNKIKGKSKHFRDSKKKIEIKKQSTLSKRMSVKTISIEL